MKGRRGLLLALVTVTVGASGCGLGDRTGDNSSKGGGAAAISALEVRTKYRPGDPCRPSGPEEATSYLQAGGHRAWLDVKSDGSTDAIREGDDLYLRNSVDPEVPWIHIDLRNNHLTAFAIATRPGAEFGQYMFSRDLIDPFEDSQRLADSGAKPPQPLVPDDPEVATVQWSVDAEGHVTQSQIEVDQTGPGGWVRQTVSSVPSTSANPPTLPQNASSLLDLPASMYAPTSVLLDPSCKEGAPWDAEEVRRCTEVAAKDSTVREWLDRRQSTSAIDGSGC